MSLVFRLHILAGGMLALVVMVVGLIADQPVLHAAGNLEAGKTIFMESCRHCHGVMGDGDSEMAGYLTPPPSNLTSASTQSKSDEELREVIRKGRPKTAMTGFEGSIEEGQLTDLLAYIRSLAKKE